MNTLGVYRHTRKSLVRLPLVLALLYDYYTRWWPQMRLFNPSWQRYLKAVRSNRHQRLRQERLTKELELVDNTSGEVVVVITWLSPGDEYTPYLCPKCLTVDTGRLFVFETVQPRRKDGSVSPLYHLSHRCTQCSARQFVHTNLFRILPPSRGLGDVLPRRRSAYSLSYEACHGSACYARRQTRDRESHEVTWVRATLLRPGMQPEVRVNNPLISNLTVDEVAIPEDHPLFNHYLHLALISERAHK
jgi:hypothetical protein